MSLFTSVTSLISCVLKHAVCWVSRHADHQLNKICFHRTKLQVNTFNFTSFNLFEGLQAFGLMQLSFLIEGKIDSLA